MEIAYIQKQNGEFINSSAYQAWEGFKLLGIPTDCFEYKQLINGYLPITLSKSTLICGFISSVRWAMEALNVPVVLDYPAELQSYLGRNIYSSTLSKIKSSNDRKFIKPVTAKLFNGFVCKDAIHTMIHTAMCPDDTKIYVSDIVNFVSEYRIFVDEGLMVGCKNYLGDFTISPDFEIISKAINEYITAPISYSADFGITDDGRTLLIEINDAWGLGCYGLDSLLYAKMLKNRWTEMVC